MLYYETSLFSKDNAIVQKITIKNCTARIEMINLMLKKFPFNNAYAMRSSCNGDDEETIIYIYLNNEVSLGTVKGLDEIIGELAKNCQQIDEVSKQYKDAINALVKDCESLKNETTESNKPTAKKECYLRRSRK